VAERPRSRATIVVGCLTILAMLIIATIFLLITSPWNDPHPGFHKKRAHKTTHSVVQPVRSMTRSHSASSADRAGTSGNEASIARAVSA
jgi:hypothetical protein